MDHDIEKLITTIVDARLEAISKKVDTLQTTLDRAISQLDDDRNDISNMRVNMGKLEAQVGGARDDIADQTKKVVNKIQENLQPLPDVVSDTIGDAIKNVKKKKWYQIFNRGGEK